MTPSSSPSAYPHSQDNGSSTFGASSRDICSIPRLKDGDAVLKEIFDETEKPMPEAVFKISDRFVSVRTAVGEYTIERSVFSVGKNYSGLKCLIVDIEDGLSPEPKLYITFDTMRELTGLSRLRGKDAVRFADRNYAAFEKIVSDLNHAVIDEATRTVPYSKSEHAYDGHESDRAYVYELART